MRTSPPILEATSNASQAQKNRDSAIYGVFLRMIESIIQTTFAVKYTTQGVMEVDATTGLNIIIVPIMNPAVLNHCTACQ